MKPRSYYNDFDKDAVAWLHRLMKAGLISKGDIDDRSIAEVQPEDLRIYPMPLLRRNCRLAARARSRRLGSKGTCLDRIMPLSAVQRCWKRNGY